MKMERVMGIGPTRLAWKARALPLSYTRIFCYWSERQDLNLRPPAPKAGALPSCAIHRYIILIFQTRIILSFLKIFVNTFFSFLKKFSVNPVFSFLFPFSRESSSKSPPYPEDIRLRLYYRVFSGIL